LQHQAWLSDRFWCAAVFTENELEKDPLKEVPAEPSELLDKTRYDFSSKQLPEEREAQLESIMSKLREECQIKGIMVCSIYICCCALMHEPGSLPQCNLMFLYGYEVLCHLEIWPFIWCAGSVGGA